jgi:hypothetical protein
VEFKTDEELSAHTGFVASWAIRVIVPVTTTPPPLRISAVTCAHVPSNACECAPPAVGAMSGTISDGSGPSPYPISATCKWLITVPAGSNGVISLSFDSFDTEEGYDFVTISRCRTSQCSARGDAEQVARLSGNAVSSTTVYSTSTTEYKFLQVKFTADEETSPNAGFVASWSISVPPPPPPPRPPLAAALTCPSGSSVCACSPSSGTSSGTISDGPSNYQPNSAISNCQWLIASTGSVFSLRFTVFDVETFSGDFGDYVDIRRCKTSACTVACALCLSCLMLALYVSCRICWFCRRLRFMPDAASACTQRLSGSHATAGSCCVRRECEDLTLNSCGTTHRLGRGYSRLRA